MFFKKNKYTVILSALTFFVSSCVILAADKQKIKIRTPKDAISGVDADQFPGYRSDFNQYQESLKYNFDTNDVQQRLQNDFNALISVLPKDSQKRREAALLLNRLATDPVLAKEFFDLNKKPVLQKGLEGNIQSL